MVSKQTRMERGHNRREPTMTTAKKTRESGIPSGNAGEYLVMGELLRRGFDAQLADRNTKGYDILVATEPGAPHRRIQAKTVRAQPWYISRSSFEGDMRNEITIYVLLGAKTNESPARFFIAKNGDVAAHATYPKDWPKNGFMPFKALEQKYENNWTLLTSL